MSKRHVRALWVVLTIATGVGVAPAAATAADSDDGRWHFHVVPYLWLPALDANADLTLSRLSTVEGTEVGPVSLSVESNPDDYLSSLNMAFMGMGEARKGPWSIYTDLIYTSFGNESSRVRGVSGPAGFLRTEIASKAKIDLSTTVWTLAGGYRAVERGNFELDLMGGFRYLTMDSDLKLTLQGADGRFYRQRKVSLDQDAWDGIVGLRGQVLFPGTEWFVPFYADVGTGDSNLTWQAMLGVGYRFNWGEITLAYRALGYDFDKNDADLTLYGPGLGVGFRW
jgi:hypothetical protein